MHKYPLQCVCCSWRSASCARAGQPTALWPPQPLGWECGGTQSRGRGPAPCAPLAQWLPWSCRARIGGCPGDKELILPTGPQLALWVSSLSLFFFLVCDRPSRPLDTPSSAPLPVCCEGGGCSAEAGAVPRQELPCPWLAGTFSRVWQLRAAAPLWLVPHPPSISWLSLLPPSARNARSTSGLGVLRVLCHLGTYCALVCHPPPPVFPAVSWVRCLCSR